MLKKLFFFILSFLPTASQAQPVRRSTGGVAGAPAPSQRALSSHFEFRTLSGELLFMHGSYFHHDENP